jgi:toxin secretion/phage lysis holin
VAITSDLFSVSQKEIKMYKLGFASVSSVLGIPLAFVFGEWTPLMGALLVMTALDIFTGVTKGFYDKSLRSRRMSEGMVRKAMIIVVIILANMIDMAMFGSMPVAKSAVIVYYIGMEGLSVVENLAQMNVPLPAFIKKYLLVLRDNGKTLEEKKVIGK